MWTMNFSGSKAELKTKHDQAKKLVQTDNGNADLIWPLVNGFISKQSVRDAQTVEVSVSGGTVDTTGRQALSINLVII